MKFTLHRWFVAASLFLLNLHVACASTVQVSLIALNDFHGNIAPPMGSVVVPDPANPAGTRVSAGGAAYLSTLIHQLKNQNPKNTLVVAAGDMLGASPLVSGLFHDEPTIEVLNKMGLDISSVGNHEFDKGRAEILRLKHGGCYPRSADGSMGVVGKDTCMHKGKFSGAKFEYLAANVMDTATGHTLFPATTLKTIGGVKIGFIGMTLKATPTVVTPAGVEGLEFLDEVETVNALVPKLRARGASAVVVLIHQGGQTSARTVQDKSCPRLSGEIVDLADRFKDVDVVVSGHTHQEYVCFRPDGKLITQTGYYGRLATRIQLSIDPVKKRVIAKDANNYLAINDTVLKDFLGKPIELPQGLKPLPRDAVIDAIVQRYGDLSASINDLPVGRLLQPLTRRANAAGESTLGDLIADMFLAGTSDASYAGNAAQIAFTNPGGIRSDLPNAGVLTFGQLFMVLPFNNYLVTLDLSGAQIVRLLEQQWEAPQPPGGRILSVSQGFSYSWDPSQPEGAESGKGRRVIADSVQLNGEPLDMNKTYRVTVNNFMVSGGDNFTLLRDGTNQQTGDTDLSVAKLYLRVKGIATAPPANRITQASKNQQAQ